MVCPDCGGVKFELFPIKETSQETGEERTTDFYLVCCNCQRKITSQELFAPRRRRRDRTVKTP